MRIDEISNSYMERLRRFLKGVDDLDTLRQALVEAEWDEELDQGLKDRLSKVDLFALEVVEGLRPEAELRQEIGVVLESLLRQPTLEIVLGNQRTHSAEVASVTLGITYAPSTGLPWKSACRELETASS